MLFLAFSCGKEHERKAYSFFVAGHVYGTPIWGGKKPIPGIYKPFKAQFPSIAEDSTMRFGVLTGDIVQASTKTLWNAIEKDLYELKLPYYFAPGNHDNATGMLYQRRYGISYNAAVIEGDLYFFLDSNLDAWNISGQQLHFLDSTLQAYRDSGNIFVFMHHPLWWSPTNKFAACVPNWAGNRPKETNFESEVLPLFTKRSNKTYFFAGDVGAVPKGCELFYYNKDNYTFIASGMGAKKQDNFIVAHVDETGKVSFQVHALQGSDKARLNPIEKFQWPEPTTDQ